KIKCSSCKELFSSEEEEAMHYNALGHPYYEKNFSPYHEAYLTRLLKDADCAAQLGVEEAIDRRIEADMIGYVSSKLLRTSTSCVESCGTHEQRNAGKVERPTYVYNVTPYFFTPIVRYFGGGEERDMQR
ncbi:hypothetical protein GCK32_003584, partial [Trichostrongylus colubriformis]